jgi:glycosyltransferase involved in cell wall biosynthesis
LVAGTAAINRALELSRGEIITHLDDDDEYLSGRISALVDYIRKERAELIWHPFYAERADGSWELNPAKTFACGSVTTSSILYHAWFKRILWDPWAYVWRQPGDWNRLNRISRIGCKLSRFDEPLLRHYKERTQAFR